MKTFYRKSATIAALIATIGPVQPTRAQLAVVCANCSSEWTQLANNAELVAQVANEARQLQQEIQQYELLAQNTAGLPNQVWGNAVADIDRVNALMAQSQALSYASSNLAGAFAARFPSYQQYASGTVTPASMQGKYQQWSNDMNSTVLSTWQAAGLQASQMQNEEGTLSQLESMSSSAGGQMQALGSRQSACCPDRHAGAEITPVDDHQSQPGGELRSIATGQGRRAGCGHAPVLHINLSQQHQQRTLLRRLMQRYFTVLLAVLVATLVAEPAHAQTPNGAVDAILHLYRDHAAAWQSALRTLALRLFWLLAGIEFAWTGIKLALKGADLGEFVAELANQCPLHRVRPHAALPVGGVGNGDRRQFPGCRKPGRAGVGWLSQPLSHKHFRHRADPGREGDESSQYVPPR